MNHNPTQEDFASAAVDTINPETVESPKSRLSQQAVAASASEVSEALSLMKASDATGTMQMLGLNKITIGEASGDTGSVSHSGVKVPPLSGDVSMLSAQEVGVKVPPLSGDVSMLSAQEVGVKVPPLSGDVSMLSAQEIRVKDGTEITDKLGNGKEVLSRTERFISNNLERALKSGDPQSVSELLAVLNENPQSVDRVLRQLRAELSKFPNNLAKINWETGRDDQGNSFVRLRLSIDSRTGGEEVTISSDGTQRAEEWNNRTGRWPVRAEDALSSMFPTPINKLPQQYYESGAK